jgi:hypothetical protein
MMGAQLDPEASGFVRVSSCPDCGTRMYDITRTYQQHSSGSWPMAVRRETWNGADVFTTDFSPTQFFCTDKVVTCARENRHTNFRFVPAEIAASSTEGVKYMV